MKQIYFVMGILVFSGIVSGCENQGQPADLVKEQSQVTEAIYNGEKVLPGEYKTTCAMQMEGRFFCSCSLITPNWVIASTHCFWEPQEGPYEYDPGKNLQILFGTDVLKPEHKFDAKMVYVHPEYFSDYTGYPYSNAYHAWQDIALVELKESVPLDVAIPIPPLPPKYALTQAELDTGDGILGTSVGFGNRNLEMTKAGLKYKFSEKIDVYCSENDNENARCDSFLDKLRTYIDFTAPGYAFIGDPKMCVLPGDSGGPVYIHKNGVHYVLGTAGLFIAEPALGQYYSGWSVTPIAYDFIKSHVTDLPPEDYEICDNDVDDNGDGKVDCDDPYCYEKCQPEDCTNNYDDNDNGLVDCEEAACAGIRKCQPEDCGNHMDDNDNGLIDCEEETCANDVHCLPEICDNGIDDNLNGLTDCEEASCFTYIKCLPENCTNGKDDNDNGLADCEDPECSVKPVCQPEICNNGIDDNANGLVDCAELSCQKQKVCQPEICDNGIDDNENGKTDCEEALCASNPVCRKEICDNGVDDNANGLVDCDDPGCAEQCVKSDGGGSSGCSSAPMRGGNSMFGLLALIFSGLGMCFRRRRAQKASR